MGFFRGSACGADLFPTMAGLKSIIFFQDIVKRGADDVVGFKMGRQAFRNIGAFDEKWKIIDAAKAYDLIKQQAGFVPKFPGKTLIGGYTGKRKQAGTGLHALSVGKGSETLKILEVSSDARADIGATALYGIKLPGGDHVGNGTAQS